jgi:hypothetical protein
MKPLDDPRHFQILPTHSLSGNTPGTISGNASPPDADLLLELRIEKFTTTGNIRDIQNSIQKSIQENLKQSWSAAVEKKSITHHSEKLSAVVFSSELPKMTLRTLQKIDDITFIDLIEKATRNVSVSVFVTANDETEFHADIKETGSVSQPAPSTQFSSICDAVVYETISRILTPSFKNNTIKTVFEIRRPLSLNASRKNKQLSHPDKEQDGERMFRQALHDGNFDEIVRQLSQATGFNKKIIEDVFLEKNTRGLISLAWKAGFSASVATALQLHVALVPPAQVIYPRDDNSYTLNPTEMNWQIEYLKHPDHISAA